MNSYVPEKIRNIALVGHSGAGKTSLAEAVLFLAKVTNRLGSVDEGNTVSDYTEAETNRKTSISTSLLHCDWSGTKVNFLDAPGYADFISDAKTAIWGADTAAILVNAQSGVEIGTDKAFGFADEFNRSSFFVINHIDKEFANFDSALEGIQERFGRGAVPFHLPANSGDEFNQIVDVLQNKLFTYKTDGSGQAEVSDVPAELQDRVDSLREQIIDGAAESDDDLMEKYFEEGELSDEEIAQGLKIGIVNRTLFPVLCMSASKNVGADLFMNFVVRQLPSPVEANLPVARKAGTDEEIELTTDSGEPLAAVVFKTISESVGDLSFLRVFSGAVKSGDDVHNTGRNANERIGQIYALNGPSRDDMETLVAGDIGALIKLKDTHTGNTLCAKGDSLEISPVEFPHPLIRVALEPKSRGDEDKIGTGLNSIHEEDPSFNSWYDSELRQMIAEGQGELHLNVVFDKLKSKFGVEVDIVEPRIPYRETILGRSEGHHRHRKQSGGRGQYGEAYLKVEPRTRGEGFEFVDAIVGGAIPGKFVPAVEKGIVEIMERGVLAGYPVVDVQATVYDGSFHQVDSSDMAFKMAGSQAFQKAFLDAKPILLEPIYTLRVTIPEEYMGDVMGDLNSRRGRIQGMDPEGKFQVIHAQVPLADLYKYSNSLRSMTQGTGDYTMEFSHYEPVPHDVTQKIIEGSKKDEELVEA
ncbi:MAG: elongation factor G [bacterium]|nr:elongation factor G [bacterium]